MAVITRLQMALDLLGGFQGDVPWREYVASAELGYCIPLAIPDGATVEPIPGLGSNDLELQTIQGFMMLIEGTLTVTWNGAATAFAGTAANPAVFLAFRTGTTTVPTVTNASGSAVNALVLVWGAQ